MWKRRSDCNVTETVYKNCKAFTMESDKIKVVVIPELGAKIVSLQFKLTGKEWLVDSGSRELKKVGYGAGFGLADMSGWDECFPTIEKCSYPFEGVYAGKELPDHGEVWSLPWEAVMEDTALVCKVNGIALPYKLMRRIVFADEQTLHLEYEVLNTGREPITVMWTAHPQFITTPKTQICLPREMKELLCVFGGRTLRKGHIYDWPEARLEDGRVRSFDQIGPAESRDSRKFYFNSRVNTGWAGLYEGDSNDFLRMSWHEGQIPYLGIWIDEGHFNDRSVCALEPSNGFYDNLYEAGLRGQALTVAPGSKANWRLDVRLGCGSREEMEEEGFKEGRG